MLRSASDLTPASASGMCLRVHLEGLFVEVTGDFTAGGVARVDCLPQVERFGGRSGVYDIEQPAVRKLCVWRGGLDEAPAGDRKGRTDGLGAEPALPGGLGVEGQAAPTIPVFARQLRGVRKPVQGVER